MKKISATIITKNESLNIERCLKSIKWVDEIIVADSSSTDNTVDICKKYGCKVFTPEWKGFGATKQYCLELAENDWVLSIDADEVVSEDLKNFIQTLSPDSGTTGYMIKRKSFYLDRLIRFSGWQRDYPLRLFDKRKSRFTDDVVHEKVMTTGKILKTDFCLYHYTYPDISTHINKVNRYSSLGAEKLFNNGKKSGIFKPVFRGGFRFIRNYFIKGGIFDGKEGLLLAGVQSFEVFLKYYKLWELQKIKKGW